MRVVYEVPASNLAKAQELLGKEDITSRQSVYTRTAVTLNLPGEKTYLIMDGSESAVAVADKLLQGLAARSKDQEMVLKKFDEIESRSAEGFGFLGI